MLNGMQARARSKHPAGEDAFDLALQGHLVDLDEGIGVCRLSRRARIACARSDLQRAELNRFADCRIEGDGAPGDLVEAGEYRTSIFDVLRGRFGDDRIVRRR